MLDRDVNPSIASHGGHAELAGIEGTTAYLRLGGGARAAAWPQSPSARGTNPYFEQAKK